MVILITVASLIWIEFRIYLVPGGFGGAGGLPPPFLNMFRGLGGGGGAPAGPAAAPAGGAGGAGAFFPFLNGLIFFKPSPAFFSTSPGGGGADGGGGALCAKIVELMCDKPKVNAPAKMYLLTFLKLFLRNECIAMLFKRLAI